MYGFWIRLAWHKYRKELGHPISLWRALTSEMPRFGSFEPREVGCPEWIKEYHKLVDR